MFIIASEQTRAGTFAKNYWTNLASPTRVFVTNLETDIAEQTESLMTFYPKRPSIKNWKTFIFQ